MLPADRNGKYGRPTKASVACAYRPNTTQRSYATVYAKLYRRMSLPNDQAIETVRSIYADTVNYFGTDMSREEIVNREMKFLARCPIRIYKPKDGQVFVNCYAVALICSASGVLDLDARSVERNQRSTGEATFEYHLRFASPFENTPKVILENGTVRKRPVQVLSPMGTEARQTQ